MGQMKNEALKEAVHKYALPSMLCHIRHSVQAKPLSLIMQNNTPTLYVQEEQVPSDTHLQTYYILGTGFVVPDDATDFLGTVVDDERYVWHVYKGPARR